VGRGTKDLNYHSTLVVAYYNIGVEYEFLRQTKHAVDSYRKGHDIAQVQLTPNHPLVQNLKRNLDAANAQSRIKQDVYRFTQGKTTRKRK
jgi:hypothetical protein